MLATVPETPARDQREMDLLTALTLALRETKGPAAFELDPLLTRAEALCQQVGEPSQRFAVLSALWAFRHVRAEYQAASAMAEQMLTLAQGQHDPALLFKAHHALGQTLSRVGAFASGCTHLEQAIALSDPHQHTTPHTMTRSMQGLAVRCRAVVARPLWVLGYPDQAMQQSQRALTMAHALAYPYSLVDMLHLSAHLHASRREWQTVQAHAEAMLALATEHGFTRYAAQGALCQGMVLAAQGQGAEGITQMRQGLEALRVTGSVVSMPFYLAHLAAASGQVGQADEGLDLITEALAVVEHTGERNYEAELRRLHGELLLYAECRVPHAALAAEECFQQALIVARHQQAKSYELRTATSLSRLWQQQGKRLAAYDLLAPVYGWFTEGFDTADLQDAKALLAALRE